MIFVAFLVVSFIILKINGQLSSIYPRKQPDDLKLLYIEECCRPSIRNDDNKLFKCVNASSEQSLLDGWPENTKSKIAIVSYATMDISGYAAYSFAVDQVYSEHNGYLLKLADSVTSNYEPKDARWNKVKILDVALQTWAKDSDYIVWLDADLIMLDLSMRIEKITSEYPHGEIWVSASVESTTNSDLMNSGFLILKNTDFVKKWLLKEWWSSGDRNTFNDQEIFDKIYMKYKKSKSLDKKVIILEPDALNSGIKITYYIFLNPYLTYISLYIINI
jgi:hypothetical protein